MESDGDSRRFCEVCTKHVHDLSAMTESMARAVVTSESAKGRMCVRYTTDSAGNIKFKPETVEAPSFWRMTVAAASMAMALFTTGCADSEPDRVTSDGCVYEVGPWSFTAERGQGTCPAVEPEEEHEMLGEIPIEPVPVMGAVAPPPPEPEPKHAKMGKIAAPELEVELQGELPAMPCDPPQQDDL